MRKKVLLFTKQNSWCDIVGKYCSANFDTMWYNGGDLPLNKERYKTYDYIISYLAPHIIPKWILDKGEVCINFHPGPPKYPGIGGYNFALYNGDKTYGVVCHFMEEKVDTGKIIQQTIFPIYLEDTVVSLKERSQLELLKMFYTIMDRIRNNAVFKGYIDWEREPYTRKNLQDHCDGRFMIDDQIDDEYLFDWYKSCYFPEAKDKPHILIRGKKYYIIREDHYEQTKGIPRWELSDKAHPWDTAYWTNIS